MQVFDVVQTWYVFACNSVFNGPMFQGVKLRVAHDGFQICSVRFDLRLLTWSKLRLSLSQLGLSWPKLWFSLSNLGLSLSKLDLYSSKIGISVLGFIKSYQLLSSLIKGIFWGYPLHMGTGGDNFEAYTFPIIFCLLFALNWCRGGLQASLTDPCRKAWTTIQFSASELKHILIWKHMYLFLWTGNYAVWFSRWLLSSPASRPTQAAPAAS